MTDSLRTRKERALSREATDRPASRPRGSSSATLQKFRPSFKGKGMSLDRVAMHRKAGAVGGGGSDDGGYEMEGIDSDDGGGEAATPLAATTKQDSARGADMFAILGGQDSLESVTVMAGGFGMEEGPFLTGGGASNEAAERDVSRMRTPAQARPKPRASASSAPAKPGPPGLVEEPDESAEARPQSRPRSRSRVRSRSRSRARGKKTSTTTPPEGAYTLNY